MSLCPLHVYVTKSVVPVLFLLVNVNVPALAIASKFCVVTVSVAKTQAEQATQTAKIMILMCLICARVPNYLNTA